MQGDLFLCAACDEYRFPTSDAVRQVRNKPQANRGTTGSVSGGVFQELSLAKGETTMLVVQGLS